MNRIIDTIPVFPGSVPVDVAHKPLFDRSAGIRPPATSDTVFTNLIGWQDYFDYRLSRWEGGLLVHYRTVDRVMFLPPFVLETRNVAPGRVTDLLVGFLAAAFSGKDVRPVLNNYPDIWLSGAGLQGCEVRTERDAFDYVYRREDLAALSGHRYAAKRNLVRQFRKSYENRYEPLGPENVEELHRFMLSMRERKAAENDLSSACSCCMACRLVRRYPALNLTGGILFADGRAVAATLATIVPDFSCQDGPVPTAVVHVENAITGYKGAYQEINRRFSGTLPEDIVLVNREEDLGVPGLRKAKLSYHPEGFVRKSDVLIL